MTRTLLDADSSLVEQSREQSTFSKPRRNRSSSSTGDMSTLQSDEEPATESSPVQNEAHRSMDSSKYSVKDVKKMVMDSIPEDMKRNIPAQTWERVFAEVSDSMTDDLLAVQKSKSEEDVNDLVSFFSVYVQREAKGERKRRDSDVSEITNPVGDRSDAPRTPMDAVALGPIAPSVTSENSAYNSSTKGEIQSNPESKSHSRTSSQNAPNSSSFEKVSHGKGNSSIGGSYFRGQVTELDREGATAANSGAAIEKRQIGFSRVEIRFYERILADNPAVTSGPPIGLGWKYRMMKKEMTIDAWEHRQLPNRRFLTELILPRNERTSLLYDLGYSQKEIAFSVREVLKVKNRRRQTFNNLRFESMEELLEKTGKTFKKVLTLGLVGRKERKMLEPYANLKKSSYRSRN